VCSVPSSGNTSPTQKRCCGRLMAMAATALALTWLPASARGAGSSGNDLWTYCTGTTFQQGMCLGLVMGIADAMTAPGGIFGRRACFSSEATAGQARDVVKRYLEQQPEQRHYPAVYLVVHALSEAFPCKP
jgi:hypothetical protein